MSEQYGPLQISPPGLLGFLQLKNSGQNPQTIDSNITPVMELRDWMFQALEADVSLNTHNMTLATGAAGFQSFTPVLSAAQSFWFRWTNYSVVATNALGAADVLEAAPAWIQSVGGAANLMMLAPAQRFSGATSPIFSARDFWLPPGAQLGLFVCQHTRAAGNTTLLACGRFTPLQR